MSDHGTLAQTWAEWDRVMLAVPRHPSSRFGERETNAMEDACKALAAKLGVSSLQLRRDLVKARVEGMSYTQAIDHVAAGNRA